MYVCISMDMPRRNVLYILHAYIIKIKSIIEDSLKVRKAIFNFIIPNMAVEEKIGWLQCAGTGTIRKLSHHELLVSL